MSPPPPTLGELMSMEAESDLAEITTEGSTKAAQQPRSSSAPVTPRGRNAALQLRNSSPPASPGIEKAALVSQASGSSLPRLSFSFPVLAAPPSSPMPLFSLPAQASRPSAPVAPAAVDEIKGANPVPQTQFDKLKNEMTVLYFSIHSDDNFSIDNVNKLINVLYTMKELKLKEQGLDGSGMSIVHAAADIVPQEMMNIAPEESSVHVPKKLKCPISNVLMTDPVILANGQTFHRPHIEEYLKNGIWICPITHEVLHNDRLIPNLFAQDIISEWCRENGIDYPEPSKDGGEENITKNYYSLTVQLERMTRSLMDKVEAAKVIRKLTEQKTYVRRFFGTYPDAIYRLLRPLKDDSAIAIFHLKGDLIAAVFHILAQDDRNKREIAKSSEVISLIAESLRGGTISTSCHAAAALLLSSSLESNKPIIGKIALRHLIELLDEGHPSALHVAAAAVSKLCTADENIERAIKEGIVKVILKKIKASIFLDDFFNTLGLLINHQNALEQMHDCGAESLLQNIMDEELSKETKKKCSVIVSAIRYYANHIPDLKNDEENSAEASGNWTLSRRTTGIPSKLRRSASLSPRHRL